MGLFGKKKEKAPVVADEVQDLTPEEVKDVESAKGIMEKLRDRIDGSIEDAGKNLVMGKIRKTINDVYNDGRIVFLGDNELEYTSRQGQKHVLGFGGMADILIEASGWDNLVRLGVMPNEVIALIEAKYKEVQQTKMIDGGNQNVNVG